MGDDIVITVDDAVFGLLGPAADYELLVQLIAQTPLAARAYIAQGLVAVDLPADPQQLFVASVPKLNSDTDATVFPASLPTTGELADELLSLDRKSVV